jgi:hypothetical protein
LRRRYRFVQSAVHHQHLTEAHRPNSAPVLLAAAATAASRAAACSTVARAAPAATAISRHDRVHARVANLSNDKNVPRWARENPRKRTLSHTRIDIYRSIDGWIRPSAFGKAPAARGNPLRRRRVPVARQAATKAPPARHPARLSHLAAFLLCSRRVAACIRASGATVGRPRSDRSGRGAAPPAVTYPCGSRAETLGRRVRARPGISTSSGPAACVRASAAPAGLALSLPG